MEINGVNLTTSISAGVVHAYPSQSAWRSTATTDWATRSASPASPTSTATVATTSSGRAVGDCDGDGRADLFEAIGACIGTCDKTEGLWLQQPDGSFVNAGGERISPSTTRDRSRFAIADDLDADGDDDLFVSATNTGKSDSANRVLINSEGVLAVQDAGVAISRRQVDCTIADDFDGHGDTDLAVCRRFRLDLYRNNGRGGFARSRFGMSTVPLGRAVGTGDLDGDGRQDLLLLTDTELQVRLSKNGRFPSVSLMVAVPDGRDVVTPDLDGDGRPDIFIVQRSSGIAPGDASADFALMNRGEMQFDRIEVP